MPTREQYAVTGLPNLHDATASVAPRDLVGVFPAEGQHMQEELRGRVDHEPHEVGGGGRHVR